VLRYTFLLFFVIHLLCDYYFQTEGIALKKKTELRWVLYHALLYGVNSILLFVLFMPGLSWKHILIFILSHGIIDVMKYFCNFLTAFRQSERNIFLLDQMMHIAVLFVLAFHMRNLDIRNICREEIRMCLDVFGVSETMLLTWIARILLIHKPTNILIAYILSAYKPDNSAAGIEEDKNAGRFIGTLERVIMAIFIALDQYSSVGLVLTAKSIARYDRITKEQNFAEYYLLGTLLSTICAVSVSILI